MCLSLSLFATYLCNTTLFICVMVALNSAINIFFHTWLFPRLGLKTVFYKGTDNFYIGKSNTTIQAKC